MQAQQFLDILTGYGADFLTGVPDSLLKPLCDLIMDKYALGENHIIAANEGAAVGLAAGRYLATGKPSVVYMQNSGIGNAVNPICSLLHEKVYAIPVIFVIGWRGEPGVPDEPQHVYQGEVTLKLLEDLQIPYQVIDKSTEVSQVESKKQEFSEALSNGKPIAYVIKKNALEPCCKRKYTSQNPLSREKIVNSVVKYAPENSVFVCTTGKLSREMFEIRENNGQGHSKDFLTVGSMGHSVMIALGIALSKPEKRVWCLDGDGAALMHMGSLAVTGAHAPANLLHLVVNNAAHETVGGMPTVAKGIKLSEIALASGYKKAYRAKTEEALQRVLLEAQAEHGPVFIEVLSNLESRGDLGRPTTTPQQNKADLMGYLNA